MKDQRWTISIIALLVLVMAGTVACGGTAPTAAPISPASSPSPGPDSTPDEPPEETLGETSEVTPAIAFTTIAQDAPLGDEPADPAYLVIVTAEGWSRIEERLPADAVEAGRNADQSQVFFTAFAGAKASSGYHITITSIQPEADQLLVIVKEDRPGEDEIVEPAMTLPFHVVAVPGSEFPEGITAVLFQDERGQTLAEHPYPLP